MECTRARSRMQAWLDGELEPEQARNMAAHVRGCASCATRMEELSALFDALESLPGLGPDPALIRDTLRAAAESEPSPVRWWTALPALHKSAGFAAVAVGLLLGFVLYSASPFAPDQDQAAFSPVSLSVPVEASTLEYL